MNKIDELSIAAIRSTCIDMIHAANSGHPGMALGSAPILYTLFKNHIISDPYDDKWANRDRFVLSSGHASSLLYTILHLCDYHISLDDLKNFRKLNSLCPGHPETTLTPGIDATSGPLGQGIAQAVGMAIAEAHLNEKYDGIIDHYTYCLCGDGCLEEGISQEAISLAGHYNLNKFILLYDSNKVTLDGPLAQSNSGDVKKRFEAENWNVLEVKDGNNIDEIDKMIDLAKKSKTKPTLIIVNTVIGYGSQNQGTSKVHGSPLKDDDIVKTKEFYKYDYPEFTIPDEVYKNFKNTFIKRGFNKHTNWLLKSEKIIKNMENIDGNLFSNDYSKELADEFNDFDKNLVEATRTSSQNALNYYSTKISQLFGGCADVAGSVLTTIKNTSKFTATNKIGTAVDFGVREFSMSAIANGIMLHGGLKPYVGCFLVFSDYMKSSIRMSALSDLSVIYIFSHDSISVGEDGPTHQPIEQLAMLRSIPNLDVIRPADARETFAAYKTALISKDHPTAIITCRNKVPLLENSSYDGVYKGAYIISKETNKVDFTIISTGSEVNVCIKAQEILKQEGIDVRIVSMPSFYDFEKQDENYKNNVLGDYNKSIFVEMGTSYGLHKYAKHVYGIDTFGKSANFDDLVKDFGFTAENIAEKVKILVKE